MSGIVFFLLEMLCLSFDIKYCIDEIKRKRSPTGRDYLSGKFFEKSSVKLLATQELMSEYDKTTKCQEIGNDERKD